MSMLSSVTARAPEAPTTWLANPTKPRWTVAGGKGPVKVPFRFMPGVFGKTRLWLVVLGWPGARDPPNMPGVRVPVCTRFDARACGMTDWVPDFGDSRLVGPEDQEFTSNAVTT